MSFNPYYFNSQQVLDRIYEKQLTQTQTVIDSQSQVNDVMSNSINTVINKLPTLIELKSLELRFEGSKIHVLVKIREAIVNLVEQIPNRSSKMYALKFSMLKPSKRATKDFDEEIRELKCRKSSLRILAVRLRLLEMIFNLIFTGTYATKRDLFYKEKDLFGTQTIVDNTITEICGFLGHDRYELHIISCAKGSVFGPMKIKTKNGDIDCSVTPISITIHFSEAEIETDAKYVIVVEKDTIFQRLIDLEFHVHFPDAILVTGRGFPDIATRKFLKSMQTKANFPFYGVMDYDPHGLHIFLTYKYGSVKHSARIESGGPDSIVDNMYFVGIKSCHVPVYCNKTNASKYTDADRRTVQVVKNRAIEVRDNIILSEINAMENEGLKIELETIVSYSPFYLIRYLLDCKKQMPWVLLSDDITKSTPLMKKNSNNEILIDISD